MLRAGTPGEARAFACADASGDGSLVVPCQGRQMKNVTIVVRSTMNDGTTCFVLM